MQHGRVKATHSSPLAIRSRQLTCVTTQVERCACVCACKLLTSVCQGWAATSMRPICAKGTLSGDAALGFSTQTFAIALAKALVFALRPWAGSSSVEACGGYGGILMHSFNVVIIESYRLLLRLSSGVCPGKLSRLRIHGFEVGVVQHTRQSAALHIFRVDMSKPVLDRRHSLRFVTVSSRAVSLYEHHQVCVAKV